MFKSSTGLMDYVLTTGSLQDALTDGLLNLYSGAVPEDADSELGAATLLATISDDGTGGGLSFESVSSGVLSKLSSQPWSGVGVETGAATFFRFVTPSDDGSQSTVFRRIQGTVATIGGDMNLETTNIIDGQSKALQSFNIRLFPSV